MQSKILFALALTALPGAALAQDYPYSSSSGNSQFMTLTNTGSTDKTMLSIYGNTPNGVGLEVWTGDWSGSYALGIRSLATASGGNTYGVFTEALGGHSGTNMGAYLYASADTYGTTYGVHAIANGNDYTNRYAVYGIANTWGSTVGFSAAGYFDGDVWAASYNWISDRKFKKDIQDVTGGLNTVMALKPRTYTLRTEEFKDKITLTEGKKLGFIAQELETVLPELVKDAVAPAHLTREEQAAHVKKEPTKYKSVDYVGVIPVLVAAIQEQQAQALDQKKQIEALRAEVAALKAGK